MKKRSIFYILASACLIIVLLCGGTVESYAASKKVKLSGKACYSETYKALNYVNKERAKRGLGKLKMDKDLQKAALQRAMEIAVFNAHTRPDGRPWYTVSPKAKGENYGYGDVGAKDMVWGWMHSSSHKKNILNKRWKSTGIACVKVYGEYYWVQLFSNCTPKQGKKLHDKQVKLTVNLY